jgi:hypothetical protein
VRSHFEYYEEREELVCNPSSSPYNMQAKVVASIISEHGLKVQRHHANMFTASLILAASLAACSKLVVKHFLLHFDLHSLIQSPRNVANFPTLSLASVGFLSIWFARLDLLCYLVSVLAGWWSMTLAMDEAGRKKSQARNMTLKREQERGRYDKIILRDSIRSAYNEYHQKDTNNHNHKHNQAAVVKANANGGNNHTATSHQHYGGYDHDHVEDVLSDRRQEHLERPYARFLKVSKSSYVVSPVNPSMFLNGDE